MLQRYAKHEDLKCLDVDHFVFNALGEVKKGEWWIEVLDSEGALDSDIIYDNEEDYLSDLDTIRYLRS